MPHSIAVMNAKGGVGKSTLVLAIAETLSAYHDKKVLVVDSDAQASVSSMFMTVEELHKLQSSEATIVDFLVTRVLRDESANWRQFVVDNVSDVDDAESVYLIPSDMQLTLFEREISKESLHSRLRVSIGGLLREVREAFDVILIDCPPGLSVLTECWLRETDFHISPTKADYISICGLEVFRRFKSLNPEMGFADNLGVIVNMLDPSSSSEADYQNWLASGEANNCFRSSIPRVSSLQDAARYSDYGRSYFAKYPGHVGEALRRLTHEFVERLSHNKPVARHPALADTSIDAA